MKTFEKEAKAFTNFNMEVVPGGVRPAMVAIKAKSNDLWMVDPEHIHIIPDYNPRIADKAYLEHVQSIKRSIMARGFDRSKPLEVLPGADGKLYLKDGHTRLKGYHLAVEEGFESCPLPVVPCEKGISMEDLTIGLVTSNSGKQLTAYETSIVVKRLSTVYHRAPSDIASALGITEKYVGQLLTLASAPIEVREMVQEGEISASLAIDMLAKHKENTVAVLQAAAGKAAGEGKKATKKDTLTPEELKKKREKKLATRLFTAVELLLADKKVIECIDPEVYKEIDTILFERDAA